MKAFIILFLFPFCSIAQQKQTLTQKVKIICLTDLKRNLNDPKSYSSVSWTDLINEYTSSKDNERDFFWKNKEYENQLYSLEKKLYNEEWSRRPSDLELNGDKKLIEKYKDQILRIKFSVDSLKLAREQEIKLFVPKFKSYYIEHTFRSKNGFGGLILTKYYFRLNKDLKIINCAVVN